LCFNGRLGGAICFNAENGQIVLRRICGHTCYIYRGGSSIENQFAYIRSKNNGINYFFETSLEQCSPDHNEARSYGMRITEGKQKILRSNFSRAYGYDVAAFFKYLEVSFIYMILLNKHVF